MAAMDIPQVLEVMIPGGNWGPLFHTGNTYIEFAAGWDLQHPGVPPPTEADMLLVWAEIEATQEELQRQRTIELAIDAFADPRNPTVAADKAVALFTMDRANELRSWLTAFLAAVANANNFVQFKNDVANLPALPPVVPATLVAEIVDNLQLIPD